MTTDRESMSILLQHNLPMQQQAFLTVADTHPTQLDCSGCCKKNSEAAQERNKKVSFIKLLMWWHLCDPHQNPQGPKELMLA